MTILKLSYGMISLGILILIVVTSLMTQGQSVQGAVMPLETPTRPDPPTLTPTDIPPTDTVEPTPPSPEKATSQPAGAFIALQVTCAAPLSRVYWTAIQWQDRLGTWHTVEGWQGTFDEFEAGKGLKRWWLPASLFGQGPFRWVIYAERGGDVLTHSAPFYLPSAKLRTLRIEVSLHDSQPMPASTGTPSPTLRDHKSVAICEE